VKFVLEVDMSEGAVAADAEKELARILRYWAGNVRHYALTAGDESAVHDSDHRDVGRWRIVEGP